MLRSQGPIQVRVLDTPIRILRTIFDPLKVLTTNIL